MRNKVFNILKLLLVLVNPCFLKSSVVEESCTFCRASNVGVIFVPLISVEDAKSEDNMNRYNMSDLVFLLTKISSEFRIVWIPLLTNRASYTMLLPKAVALFNTAKSSISDNRYLEAWIFLLEPSLDTISENMLLAYGESVKTANKIHDNTITTVILEADLSKTKSSSFQRFFRMTRKVFPKEKYKLGMTLSTRQFIEFTRTNTDDLSRYIQTSFELVDLVIFKTRYEGIETSSSISNIVRRETNLVTTSVMLINKKLNQSLHFGVLSKWPDTSKTGVINYSKQVEFWESITEFGQSENFTVIFNKAFDYPRLQSTLDEDKTLGWWRLHENSSYSNTSQFVFHDKRMLASKQENMATIISHIEPEIMFNRNLVGVKFTPISSIFDTGISQNFNLTFLSILVQKVASNFISVLINEDDVIRWGWKSDGRATVFDIIHKYNSKAISHLYAVLYSEVASKSEVITLAERIKLSNKLYNNLITKVALLPMNDGAFHVKSLRELLSQSVLSRVPVGYHLPIGLCAGSDYKFKESPMHTDILDGDFVVFSYVITESAKHTFLFGIDRVLNQVTTLFDNCKRRMMNIHPTKMVSFQTGYDVSLISKREDFVSLVIFWKEMNSWALRTNTSVILSEAFEPIRNVNVETPYGPRLGWWRFVPHGESQNEFEIEEKRTAAIREFREALFSNESRKEQENRAALAIIISVVIGLVIIFFILLTLIYKKIQTKADLSVNEFPRIEICNENILSLPCDAFVKEASMLIGVGNFGSVYKCRLPQFLVHVAVKTLFDDNYADQYMSSSAKNLLLEIKIMLHVGFHENILELLGVCQENALFIVTEYCENGSLLSFLRSQAAEKMIPEIYELLHYCIGISNGMMYLEEKQVIHGDLSARNVLLDSNKTCKISDFGLSRKLEQHETYKKAGNEPIPWRWMAIECLTRLEFSFKSDVWSMGVTFWEVFTLGKLPFPEMAWDETFCDKLVSGLRLGKPDYANEKIYQLMLKCWEIETANRPSFKMLTNQLKDIKASEYVSL